MLCSLPTSKSSSTWLDRLHTLKGFNNPNSLISNPNTLISNPNSSNPNSNPNPIPPTEQMRPFNLVSDVLSDLFVMDAPNSTQSQTLTLKIMPKRGLRKQANPRICISANKSKTRNYSLPSGDTTVSEAKSQKLKKSDKLKVNKKIEKEKKKRKKRRVETGLDLDSDSGPYSGTEATVIDTSTPGWKSAKMLFRKGSIWKVRDKKQFNAAKKKKKHFKLIDQKSNEEPSSSTFLQKNHTPPINEDTLEEPIDPIQIPIIRPKYSKPSVPDAAKSIALHLKVRTKGKKKNSPLSKSSPLKGKNKI